MEDPEAIAEQREERARSRVRQTARDMVISMVVVAAAVDPTLVIAGARATEHWPVYAPVGLPATWRCTSARITTALDGQDIVHLGYLTPTDHYAGLEQSATKALTFVTDSTVGGRQSGTRVVAGTTWTTYESPDGSHRSLVRTANSVTYVVVGTGTWDEISTFTASLQAPTPR